MSATNENRYVPVWSLILSGQSCHDVAHHRPIPSIRSFQANTPQSYSWRHSGSQTRNTPGRGGPNSPKTQQPPSQQQQQQRGTGGNKGQQSQKSNSNQANADRSRSTSGFKGHGKSQSATINNVTSGAAAGQTANHSRGANALQEVKHVPVKGFNSWETKEYLKKSR